MKKYFNRNGFSLIELIIVIAIIACLATITIPSVSKFLAKAKRTEALINLRSLAMAEKIHFFEHGTYTTNLNGKNGMGWKPEGTYNYTYGFNTGAEGQDHFIGQLKAQPSALQGSHATTKNFKAYAAADLGGRNVDIIAIDENYAITIVSDGLA